MLRNTRAKDKVKVLGYWASPFALIVEWYIEEDLKNKSPVLLQYNPVHKKVPVFIHNGKPVAESLVIIENIDETWKQNPIFPEDPYEKATMRLWANYAEEKFQVIMYSVKWVKGEQEKAVKEARKNLKTLEMGLKGKFFGGEKIGFAYLAAGWIPYWTKITEEMIGVKLVDEENMPLLSVWFDDVLDDEILKEILPPWDKALAHHEAFRDRLVSATTSTRKFPIFITQLLINISYI
ncbi:hypothetical protein MKX01_036357 [Papaver californicum]|nr:hypothetical protein MKX01_036357 [Papaver californicum]